ncbi:MAG: hypothetical protein U5O15_07535 [Candidatus Krumholzibacteriota bacterium]|nr:hypothetical protein [Candidatus Krumholzibacteriota bacterium]
MKKYTSESTGAYRFPVDRAALIALKTIAGEIKTSSVSEVRVVLFSKKDFDIYSAALEKISE